MIKKLDPQDIKHVARIHREELPGFLSEFGEEFLNNFYRVSSTHPEIFIFVEKKDGHILGFVQGSTSTKGMYKKVIFKAPLQFLFILSKHFITHPENVLKAIKSLLYPGFSEDAPELLTIAVSKKHQKKGIGRKLFLKTANEFRRRGLKSFKISTYERLSANGFYKKIGCKFVRSFRFLGERMNYYEWVS